MHDKIIRCVFASDMKYYRTETDGHAAAHFTLNYYYILVYTLRVGKPSIIQIGIYNIIFIFLVVHVVHVYYNIHIILWNDWSPRARVGRSPPPPWNAINSTLVSLFFEIIHEGADESQSCNLESAYFHISNIISHILFYYLFRY